VTETYEIWLGPNRIAVWEAGSALLALIEYLHGEGVPDEDIVRLGPHEVSWRGATYRALAADPAHVLHSAPHPG
jgi:hypothetical protein